MSIANFTEGQRIDLNGITLPTEDSALLLGDKLNSILTQLRSKEVPARLGDVSATLVFRIMCPNHAGVFGNLLFVGGTAVAVDDSNYWKFGAVNKGTDNSGTAVVVDSSAAANSTKATGGTALAANVPRALTLTSTAADLVHAANDVLE